ncbi:MAG TPA: hypothetical protein DIC22_06080 [Chitinophagaceae bacterium]|jgi:hypothetical protein|nr:hypothetical protein [Chitinophagaceae bacterium]
MKANLIRRITLAIILVSCISMFSCKKDTAATSGTTTANLSTAGDDQQQVSNESDIISNDANTALNGQSDFSGSLSSSVSLTGNTEVNSVNENTQVSSLVNVHQFICDATISYDTSNNQRTITIVYDGTNCWGNRTRTGTVIISLPYGQHWKDAGATATVTIDTLTITRLRDGKSIVLNGTKTITNVSGGLLKDLATLQTITHTITGSLKVDFESGISRTWNVSKQRVFTYDNGIVIATTGTYSDGTDNNIAEWGTNRFGETFKSLISTPKVIRQDCDFRLVSGQNTVKSDKGTSVITYGLDAAGEPTGCPGSGTYYFKLVWTGANGNTFTIIRPY